MGVTAITKGVTAIMKGVTTIRDGVTTSRTHLISAYLKESEGSKLGSKSCNRGSSRVLASFGVSFSVQPNYSRCWLIHKRVFQISALYVIHPVKQKKTCGVKYVAKTREGRQV